MPGNLQDTFLAQCKREGVEVTVSLMNGVLVHGIVTGFDPFTLLIASGEQELLLYKHAISAISPATTLHGDRSSSE